MRMTQPVPDASWSSALGPAASGSARTALVRVC